MSNYLLFEMMDAFLENPRLKKIYRIPVGILNTFVTAVLTISDDSTAFIGYVAFGTLLFVEFVVFYKDKLMCSLFCALACLVHLMAIRSLCVACFAFVNKITVYDVVNDQALLVWSMGATVLFLNVAVFAVIKLIPAKGVRIINQHNELLWFLTAWLVVFCGYLLVNSNVYNELISHPTLLHNQVTAPVTILVGTYITLFFSIKMSELLGYKEKNEELQHTVDKERYYRTSIDKGVFRVIDVNFSNNTIVSGFEDCKDQLGDMIYNYREMFAFMMRTTVHPDDSGAFVQYGSPHRVVEEFERGRTDMSFDYRRLMSDGNYKWMRVFMPLMKDKDTGDIKGFAQIKNIDTEKKQQLDLQYKAERDLLTRLYNKVTTEKLITSLLTSNNDNTGVLFIIDIDNFKAINDNLGHLYGDAVLSELSEGLKGVFTDSDIVGRIGGDEFLVFSRGLINQRMIIKKANDICKVFLRTYGNEKGEGYKVSGSVGISIFPKDGRTFEGLFKCADAALYTTKARGKNGYSLYDENISLPYVSARTEIDTRGVVQKNFRNNRVEYVFRLLYGSEDTKFAIESALELIAKNFGFSRANIFEFNERSTHFNGVFEWCANGIDSVGANYIDMPLSSFDFVIVGLEKTGGMFMAVPTDFPVWAQDGYTSIGIKSIVHFSIKERDKLIGVIAFQHCITNDFTLSDTEFEELRTICQVLSVFMAKQLSNERELRHHRAIEAVMDNMNSIAYVVDREHYEIYYENQNVIDITGRISIGNKCYYSYRGLDVPCPDCPLNNLSATNLCCTLELYTEKFDIYTKTSAALIDWSNDKEALLISSVDITKYMRRAEDKNKNKKNN